MRTTIVLFQYRKYFEFALNELQRKTNKNSPKRYNDDKSDATVNFLFLYISFFVVVVFFPSQARKLPFSHTIQVHLLNKNSPNEIWTHNVSCMKYVNAIFASGS